MQATNERQYSMIEAVRDQVVQAVVKSDLEDIRTEMRFRDETLRQAQKDLSFK